MVAETRHDVIVADKLFHFHINLIYMQRHNEGAEGNSYPRSSSIGFAKGAQNGVKKKIREIFP